jgi:uncharacterized protein YjbI with pentapeptide repeats
MPEGTFQQPINSAARIIEEYSVGKRNFEKAELAEANLQNLNLKGSNFSYADLSTANLCGANMRGCDLSFADLSEANLQDADLRGTMLFSANLRQANLQGTQLEKAECDRNTHFPSNFDALAIGISMSDSSV